MAAASLALARAGYPIVGVHLDLRGTIANGQRSARRDRWQPACPSFFHNINAADDGKRAAVIEDDAADIRGAAAQPARIRSSPWFLHSLAFGTTLSYVSDEAGGREVSQKQLEMTADVMAHSLIYWVRDLFHAGLLGDGQPPVRDDQRGRCQGRPDLRASQRGKGRARGALSASWRWS